MNFAHRDPFILTEVTEQGVRGCLWPLEHGNYLVAVVSINMSIEDELGV